MSTPLDPESNIGSNQPFTHQRHKPPTREGGARDLILACPPLRSNVNLARIVRTASCCGVQQMVVCGRGRIDPKIARGGTDQIQIERRRSLPPVLKKFRAEGLRLVGLEQTTNSHNLCTYQFTRRTVLVIGHERLGLEPDVLNLLDEVVEIPVFGLPYSLNVATATAMALYEYCRQHGQSVDSAGSAENHHPGVAS